MHPFMFETLVSRPPHGFDAGEPTSIKRQAFTAAQHTEVQLFTDFRPRVFCFRADQDCYVRFGETGLGPVTTTDFKLRQYEIYPFLITYRDRFFRGLRVTTDGNLEYWNTSIGS